MALCQILPSLVNIWQSYCRYKKGIRFTAHSVVDTCSES